MPDEEMIERCMKAAAQSNEQNGAAPYDLIILNKHAASYLREEVIAIIKAMREPTEKMIVAGCEGNPTIWNEGTDEGFAANVASDVYQSMIDEILK